MDNLWNDFNLDTKEHIQKQVYILNILINCIFLLSAINIIYNTGH